MKPSVIIQGAMKKRKLRNCDLDLVIGNRGHTSEIVSGKRGVPKSKAAALAKLLCVPIHKLLGPIK